MRFFDSNILVYAHSLDQRSAVARALLADEQHPNIISVQCLNEFVNVARRKLEMSWTEIGEALDFIHTCCPTTIAMTLPLHERGLILAERYQLSVYDALIAAAALEAECDTLYSEDLHHGLVIDGLLRVENPFIAAP